MESGVEFNFSFAPGITDEQIIGVELAGEMWSNYLGDTQQSIHKHEVVDTQNTVINIHVEMGSELPENVIGGSFPTIADKYKYDKIHDALSNDITTDNDRLAVDSLINAKETDVLVNGELVKTESLQLTTANLKALDLIDSNSEQGKELDGYILMSDLSGFDSVEWNYDYLGGAKEGTLDFLSTITHEIGHTLGFISGTDRVKSTNEALTYYENEAFVNIIEQGKLIKEEWRYTAKLDGSDDGSDIDPNQHYGSYFKLKSGSYKNYQKFNTAKNEFEQAIDTLHDSNSSLDGKAAYEAFESIADYLKFNKDWHDFIKKDELFKETQDYLNPQKLASKMTSLDLFRYSNESSDLDANELTRGSSSYFSLNGSQTNLAMSNGQDYQGSHWQDRNMLQGLGVMNPTVALNERWEISNHDLMAMDAIGWDVDYSQSLNIEALYNKASMALDSALIENRQDEVDQILDGDAYEGRPSPRSPPSRFPYNARSGPRARPSRFPYNMTLDGYFSTFSEFKANFRDSASEVVTQIDNWVVVTNNYDNYDRDINFSSQAQVDDLVTPTKSINKVTANYLEIDSSTSQDLLQEIKASLNTGLEIEMAVSTL